MYFVINDLDNPGIDEDKEDSPFLEIHEELITNPRRGWHSGAVLDDPPARTIIIEATPHFGYTGPPPDYYDDSISLMSPHLKKVIENAGVDTIHYYPVVIKYRGSGETYDWFAFNINRLISAVDCNRSDVRNEDGALVNESVHGFTVDTEKACGTHLFRLAENVATVLVSDQVKNAIEAAGIHTFGFSNPEDWVMV